MQSHKSKFKNEVGSMGQRAIALVCIVVLSTLLWVSDLAADMVNIWPSDDACVDSNYPDDNYGFDRLYVGYRDADQGLRRSYLKFDLSLVPSGRKIVSARLRLPATHDITAIAPEVGAHYLQDDTWDESTITWNNAPTGFEPGASDTNTVVTGDNYWDLTADVYDAYRGDGVFGVVMKLVDEASYTGAEFCSRQCVVSPGLEVEYIVEYSGGSGTAEHPYRIATAEDLNDIGNHPEDWGSHFVMVNDINLADYTGMQFNLIPAFRGVFDGNDHTVSNFTYNSTGANYVGLFRRVGVYMGEVGEIRDLGLIEPNVDAGTGDYVGSLVGGLSNGTITRCYAHRGTISGDRDVGGLVGYTNDGMISDCYSTTSVSGDRRVGGLIGANAVPVSNSYSAGIVAGNTNVGGLVGLAGEGGWVTCSFWDIETSGQVDSAGGKGKTTAEMMTESTFTDAGWDFVDVWDIGEGQTYPFLRQYLAGDVNHDGLVDWRDFAILASRWLEGAGL
jgi:hypothetical protein